MPGPLDVELGPYRVSVATAFGPRVLGLSLGAGAQMFADLGPDLVIELADSGVYRFRGGHRLWAAPEVPAVSYAQDDLPCHVVSGDDQLTISAPTDRVGLAKTIALRLEGESLLVDHTLANQGPAPMEVAPWAITQLRLGGTALIPTAAQRTEGLQASHSLVLWPYTELTDQRLTWRERALEIEAGPGPPFKIGVGPAPGRLGYLLDGQLFLKEVPAAGGGDHVDRGAVGQVYLNESFCELESLGPLTVLAQGGTVSHREVWVVEDCDGLDRARRRVAEGAGR